MKESVSVTELDLALVYALQIRPRAAWTEIAPSLGVTAVTLARRWERLTEAGAGVAVRRPQPAYSHSRRTAFVPVGCRPAARESLAARIAELNEAATVELTAPGSADLLGDVLAANPADVHRFVDEHLAPPTEVTSVEGLFATSPYTEGSRWRLGSLDPAQLFALGRRQGGAPDAEASASAPARSTARCSTPWLTTDASDGPLWRNAWTSAPRPSADGSADSRVRGRWPSAATWHPNSRGFRWP
ncbi:Lrp/AsnC family transcriptional regulator [Streptomyces sp. M92]|nr:Lrp/AsnC family transcriptional regulator [Streptomyces sp. M92]WCN05358.1 Lrp/AsnC family transcriptional regulator [Streptomyces sp. M92]